MNSNANEFAGDPRIAAGRMRRPAVARSVKSIVVGAVVAATAAFATAAPAAADIVRIEQVSTGRSLDAWEDAGHDYQAVVWSYQDNDTQLWRMTHVEGNVYTFQQVSSERYLDAHENDANDWNVVTRPAQNNDTQRWLVTDLGGGINYIQQVSSGRYLDAYEDSGHGWRNVTRPFQNNATQQWRITVVMYELVPLPIDPGLIVPVTPPVHSSGTVNLSSPFSLNLDDGTIAFAGADLTYMAPDLLNLQLMPMNGAEISFTDGTERGYAGCWAATYSPAPVPLASLAPGNYLCVKTSEGRISEFTINSIGALLRILSISYTTWE